MRKATNSKLSGIPTHMTDVIAERRLTLVEDGKRRRVLVRIGAPARDVPVAGGRDWRCPFRITGHSQQLQAVGVDSMQALTFALQIVEILLSSREGTGQLEWLGQTELGFPKIRHRQLKRST